MKALLVLVACVLGGLAGGAIWTWLQADRYRADARVLVRPAGSRIVPAVEALAESSLVESNVAQTLRLSSPPNISATRGDGGVLTISVEAGGRERARQIDAEAVVLLTQKVAQRFAAVGVTATLLDPAHVAEQTSPTPGRNVLVTGLIGLVAGLAAAFGRGRSSRAGATADPQVEQRLQARIEEVGKRERALAKRAGELAAREKGLEQREEELAAAASRFGRSEQAVDRREQELAQRQREVEQRIGVRERQLEQRDAELTARVQELEAAAAAAPEPELANPRRMSGRWTLQELEALVAERSQGTPEQQEEWTTYLFFLREHGAADGTLPTSFDQLVNDVFGPLPLREE